MDSPEATQSNNGNKGAEVGKPNPDASLSYLGLIAANGYDIFAGPATDEDEFRQQFATHAAGFVKTASLFLRGRVALPLAMASFGLDQAKPADPWDAQAWDAGLGMTKGAAMRGAFKLAAPITDHGLKGAVLGVTSRTAEVGLDRNLFTDQRTGHHSLSAAVDKFSTSVLDKKAIAFDMLVFGASAGLSRGADKLLNGRISQSPLLSTMSTGATFGFTGGGLEEMQRQTRLGGDLDLGLIAQKAFVKGGIDSVASIAGGLQARNQFQTAQRQLDTKYRIELQRNTNGQGIEQVTKPGAPAELRPMGKDAMAIPIQAEPMFGENFRALSRELSAPGKDTVQLPVRKANAPEKCATEHEFMRDAIDHAETPVRVYRYGQTEILVPEQYAAQLDKVREYRIAAEGADGPGRREIAARILGKDVDLTNRALPEDLIPGLKALPDQSMVRRAILLNTNNPEDAWHQQQLGDKNWQSAGSSAPTGELTFYRRNADIFLPSDIGHEWAHLLKDRQASQSAMFAHASTLESKGYMQRSYAATHPNENWAVHLGEDFLHRDTDVFINLGREAPIRTAIFAQALKPTLALSDSPFKAQHQERIDYVERHVLPRAQAKLLEIAGGENPAHVDPALRLLLQLGTREQLGTLKNNLVSLNGEPISDPVLANIAAMPNVRHVDVSNTLITQNGLKPLHGMPLQSFAASNTSIGDKSVAALSGITSLRHIDLSHTAVGDGGLVHLRSLPHLRSLNVDGTQASKYGIDYLLKANPKLQIGAVADVSPTKLAQAEAPQGVGSDRLPAKPAQATDGAGKSLNVRSNSGDPVGELMSNFAHTPFHLDGKSYASVEGFYAALKFNDANLRAQAAELHGSRAKNFARESTMTETTYEGQTIKLGSPEHHALIKRAIRAKLEQNPDIQRAFAESYPQPIEHQLRQSKTTNLPNNDFCRMLMELRVEAVQKYPDLQLKFEVPKSEVPKLEPVPLQTVREALNGITEPHIAELHNLAAYAKAFENFDRRVDRVIAGGADSVVLRLEDGNVLKITTRSLPPDFGKRWFDSPILETGSKMVDGRQINYFVQSFARNAKPQQVEQFLKDLEKSGFYMRDYNPANVGWDLVQKRAVLVDPFSVEAIPGR